MCVYRCLSHTRLCVDTVLRVHRRAQVMLVGDKQIIVEDLRAALLREPWVISALGYCPKREACAGHVCGGTKEDVAVAGAAKAALAAAGKQAHTEPWRQVYQTLLTAVASEERRLLCQFGVWPGSLAFAGRRSMQIANA